MYYEPDVSRDQIRTSKFLSLVLRHNPAEAGVTLDRSGWCDVDDLLKGAALRGFAISREELEAVVSENDKKRFEFSSDGERIRASQGHSVQVELDYEPKTPPEMLFHGTATKFLVSIGQIGLIKGSRHHVHLSSGIETARKVGERHGKPAVIPIEAGKMHRAGVVFFLSTNGVWLTDHVAPEYLRLDEVTF
jgi:putative RNA 2'-phosphotransferase